MKPAASKPSATGSNGARMTYERAGVHMAAADAWLKRMQGAIRSTHGPEVLKDLGAFAGLFRLPAKRFRDPVLVSSTDGVGTKLKLAQLTNSHANIGIDAVAMNTNDVLVYGAAPLFFLDYIAIGRIQPSVMSGLLRGMVKGCRLSGCALLGGETAEMPGLYNEGEYDVAGFCVGIVDRANIIDGRSVRAGATVIGLASSGVHANGFSLVRRVFSTASLLKLRRQLLVPTRIYVKPVLAALRDMPVQAMVHVTGGGLSRRLPSLVARAPGLYVHLEPWSWRVPPIFQTIQEAGQIATDDMMKTFNMGIGMALVCRPKDAPRLVRGMCRAGVAAWPIGTIEPQRS